MKPMVTAHMSTPLIMVGSVIQFHLAAPLKIGRSQLNKASYITIN